MDFEVIVLGAGVNGSSAAFHSAKSGRKTALVEQFPALHSRGSSGGHSRIIRLMNNGFPEVSQFMDDSLKQWREIEKSTDEKLMRPASMMHVEKFSSRAEREKTLYSLERFGITPKITDAATFNRANGTHFSNDCTVIEDPSAGVLVADKCLKALQNLFKQHGGVLLDEFGIDGISVSHLGDITVSGPKGQLKCKKLIICAGPWSNKVLNLVGIVLPLRILKTASYYWQILEPFELSKHSFVDGGKKGAYFYGLPAIEYPGMMKIGQHVGVAIDPDHRDESSMEEYKEDMCRYISETLPQLKPTPAIIENCIYTSSPDKEMILDSHPIHRNIAYVCGFSGTGFKTGPSVGRTLCELVEGKKTTLNIEAFKASRFASSYFKLSNL